jgi:TonB family protein
MKNLQNTGKQPRLLLDSTQSQSGALLKTGIFSFLLHIFLICFLIFSLKPGIIKSRPTVYRVTIQPLSLQNSSNSLPLQALPAPQPIPEKPQIKKEENKPKKEVLKIEPVKEVVKQSEPVEEPKQVPQPLVDDQTIQKPIPLPMAETSTLNADSNLEKEDTLPILAAVTPAESDKSAFVEIGGGGTGIGKGVGTGGIALGGSGEGGGSGGDGTGWGRRSGGWVSSREESGGVKGGPGFGGSGTGAGTGGGGGRGGSGGGSGGSGSAGALLRYGKNPKPPYPQEARAKGYQGKVILKVEVLSNGRVGDIFVKESSGYEVLDESALTTVKKWIFVPATKGGVAIPDWVNQPITFQLQDVSFW